MRIRLGLCTVAAVVVASCSEDTTAPPPPALSIRKAPTGSGDGQTDTVRATLAPFRVLVSRGTAPAPGIAVLWTPSDSFFLPRHVTTTDASGIASTALTLGTRPGAYTVTVAIAAATGSTVAFSYTAVPGRPAVLRIVSGNNQEDTTKARLGTDYTVQATDTYGNAVTGVAIEWAVTAGGGSITPTHSTTGSGGYAAARHTLGPSEGAQTVTATVSGLPVTPQVIFTTTAFGVGNLQLTATTTGVDLDPNGYRVTVDGATVHTTAALAANATVTIRLRATDYRVALSDVAVNCDTTGPRTRMVTVPSGGSAAAAFGVACATATLLAFVGTAAGNGDIYTIKSNGAAATRLTTNTMWDGSPAWSPDGSKIAFESDRDGNLEIYVMNADGSSPLRLTNSTAADRYPSWSPDGTKIAFTSERDAGDAEIYVMNSDGSNPVRLTNALGPDLDAVWSPDGSKLAFWSSRSGDPEIYVMNADGTNPTRLTNHAGLDADPAWSPDGTKLAFLRDYYYVMVMNADGSGVKQVTAASGAHDPVWSPDGRRIAFANEYCDYYYYYNCVYSILIVRVDGTDLVELIDSYASDPDWRH